ncbi:MAG: AarF/UbiB family protein [Chloroflexi bacterium]|nr:AarF/UbiB family protein [Chloroflexota bacterium]
MYRHRYRRILWFFAGVISSFIWWDIILPRFGLRGWARRTRPGRLRKVAARYRVLAIDMGGVLIKVGQFLSARLDVLPVEITNELSGLQDEVQPEPFDTVRRVVEAEFGMPITAKYAEFSSTPLASASIGQVHRARIRLPGAQPDTEPSLASVVVKIQRPDIQDIVETDLAALRVVGGWIQRYPPIRKRAHVPSLLEEFSHSLHEEIDYLTEGKNAETFATNFRDRKDICVPQVYWDYTTRCVLTLEDVWSIKITDYAAIEAAGIDRKEVAERLFDTYLKQIFEDRFFHADPHPGNLFVMPVAGETEEPERVSWQLVFVDFGMVGRVLSDQFAGLREMLISVGTQDASRLVNAEKKLGVLLPTADLDLLERAGARMFDQFWGKTTPEMMDIHREEALKFAQEFRDLIYEMPFQVPENLILLGRCVSILSGMCTGLYPDFNLWSGLAPYATRLVESEQGSRLQTILNEIGNILRILVSLPARTENLLNRIEQGKLEVRDPELHRQVSRLTHSLNRLTGGVIFAAFFLGGVQLYLSSQITLATLCAAAAGLILIWLLVRS